MDFCSLCRSSAPRVSELLSTERKNPSHSSFSFSLDMLGGENWADVVMFGDGGVLSFHTWRVEIVLMRSF